MKVDRPAASPSLTATREPAPGAEGAQGRAGAATSCGPLAGGRLGAWCGWVMVGASILTPVVGWLSPLGFAPLMAVAGLLCLPAFSLSGHERPIALAMLGALIWAAASTLWTPFDTRGAHSVLLQLSLALPLYWCAVCGARRADPKLNELALRILGVGLAVHAALLLADVVAGAELFRALHVAFYEPITPILAKLKLAQTTFVLAALWPVVLLPSLRGWRGGALTALTLAGVMIAAYAFFAAAPLGAAPLSLFTFLIVLRWPRGGPRLLAASAAVLTFAMPAIVLGCRATGDYGWLEAILPDSWSARLSYWSHAVDDILARPLRGWGLDASRHMAGMVLHPHNSALQIWLELGLPGALAATAFWFLSLRRLARDVPDRAAAGAAGAAVAYLLFTWANFGAWQQWWLALGALITMLASVAANRPGRVSGA